VKKGKKIKDGTGGGNRFANEMKLFTKWREIAAN